MECVPNFSEGRDLAKIEKIVDKFRAKAGVKLLDYSNDEDHNRLVVTVVGEPEALKDALLEAIGQAVELKERGIVQVSINMTDYTRTALYRAFELVRIEARRYGVPVVGSEIIGLVPMEALIDTASYYLGLEDFSIDQVLETRIMG